MKSMAKEESCVGINDEEHKLLQRIVCIRGNGGEQAPLFELKVVERKWRERDYGYLYPKPLKCKRLEYCA